MSSIQADSRASADLPLPPGVIAAARVPGPQILIYDPGFVGEMPLRPRSSFGEASPVVPQRRPVLVDPVGLPIRMNYIVAAKGLNTLLNFGLNLNSLAAPPPPGWVVLPLPVALDVRLAVQFEA